LSCAHISEHLKKLPLRLKSFANHFNKEIAKFDESRRQFARAKQIFKFEINMSCVLSALLHREKHVFVHMLRKSQSYLSDGKSTLMADSWASSLSYYVTQ